MFLRLPGQRPSEQGSAPVPSTGAPPPSDRTCSRIAPGSPSSEAYPGVRALEARDAAPSPSPGPGSHDRPGPKPRRHRRELHKSFARRQGALGRSVSNLLTARSSVSATVTLRPLLFGSELREDFDEIRGNRLGVLGSLCGEVLRFPREAGLPEAHAKANEQRRGHRGASGEGEPGRAAELAQPV